MGGSENKTIFTSTCCPSDRRRQEVRWYVWVSSALQNAPEVTCVTWWWWPSVPGPQPRAWHVLIRPSPLLVLVLVMVTGGNYPVSGYNQGSAGSSVGWLNFYIDPHNVQKTSIHRKLGCLSTNIFTDRQLVVEQHGFRDKHPNVWITCLFKHSFSKDP